MKRRTTRSTRTDTLFPYTTLIRAAGRRYGSQKLRGPREDLLQLLSFGVAPVVVSMAFLPRERVEARPHRTSSGQPANDGYRMRHFLTVALAALFLSGPVRAQDSVSGTSAAQELGRAHV